MDWKIKNRIEKPEKLENISVRKSYTEEDEIEMVKCSLCQERWTDRYYEMFDGSLLHTKVAPLCAICKMNHEADIVGRVVK